MEKTPAHVPLVRTIRGSTVECVHVGSIAVVDVEGRLLAGAGDPEALHYTRSALKPLQALPFVEDGGLGRFGFGSQELAMMCASHNGEAMHVGVVSRMLERIGAGTGALQCGCHPPMYYATTGTPPPRANWSPLFHNCSGKHAGFLAWSRLHGQSLDDYLDPDGLLQRRVRAAVQPFSPDAPLAMGIDGCSAPNFAMPLRRLAQAYARIAEGRSASLRALFHAMTLHPDLVSGTGRNDLALMRAGTGAAGPDWVAKVGADGVQAICIRSRGIGIVVRVADGGARALAVATHAALEQLGLLEGGAGAALDREAPEMSARALRNWRGTPVGRYEATFSLPRLS